MRPQEDYREPVSEGIDGEDHDFLLEDIHPPRPAFEVFVGLMHPLSDRCYEPTGVLVVDAVLLGELSDQLLDEERGVEVALAFQVLGQEHEVEHFDVVPDDGVVEVGVGLQLLQVVRGHWERLRFVGSLVFESELVACQFGSRALEFEVLLEFLLPCDDLLLLVFAEPFEELVLPLLRELRQLQVCYLLLNRILEYYFGYPIEN